MARRASESDSESESTSLAPGRNRLAPSLPAAHASLGRRPVLSAVLDARSLGLDPKERALELFAHGADWIQLRDRSLDDASLWRLLCLLVEARRESTVEVEPGSGDGLILTRPPRVIVNKRVDLARAAEADGVHLGFDSLPVAWVRPVLGRDRLVGVSTHGVQEVAELAERGRPGRPAPDRPSYVHLAPVWDPRSKPATRPPLGLDQLTEACRFGLPVIAQGGLDADRAEQAIRAGAAGIAVSGLLMSDGNLGEKVAALRESLDRATAPNRVDER